MAEFSELIGVTLREIRGMEKDSGRVEFVTEAGTVFYLHHDQDCCEHVAVSEIIGDKADLLGTPIIVAEERISDRGAPEPEYPESWTWTFYELRTIKGSVTIRWLGESNGYYSESVDFDQDEALEGRRSVAGLLTN